MKLITTTVLHVELLPVELKNNNTGRGHSHWHSTNMRKSYEKELRLGGFVREPFSELVDITLCRVLGKNQRLWDADSVLRGSAKELIDALVACGWFHDDGPQWIRHAVGIQDAERRNKGPGVVIAIESVA